MLVLDAEVAVANVCEAALILAVVLKVNSSVGLMGIPIDDGVSWLWRFLSLAVIPLDRVGFVGWSVGSSEPHVSSPGLHPLFYGT